MKFFVPAADDASQAEQVYQSIASFNGVVPVPKRVYKLAWLHNGRHMACAVGEPLPTYFQTGAEPVLAVLDAGRVYLVCTPSRGGLFGEPILCGKESVSRVEHFEAG